MSEIILAITNCVNCGSADLHTALRCKSCEAKKLESSIWFQRNTLPLIVACKICKRDMIRYSFEEDGHAKYFLRCSTCANPELRGYNLVKLYDFRFRSIIPAEYGEMDLEIFPSPSKYAELMEWQFDPTKPKGLFLVGESGMGKTRCAYKIVEKLIYGGLTVKAFLPNQFSREIIKRFADNSYNDWFDSLLLPDIIFWDDFGKDSFTERVKNDFFALLERRLSNKKSFIFTSADDENTLGEKMNDRTLAKQIFRRIKDYSHIHVFEGE